MGTISTADLITKFRYALTNGWGYILGTWHTQWTQSLQNAKVSYMQNKYGSGWKTSEKAKADDYYYRVWLKCPGREMVTVYTTSDSDGDD